MPTYTNTGSNTIFIANIEFPPGVNTISRKYVNHPDLTFVSHNPRVLPFKTIHNGTIASASSGLTGMESFQFMTVHNLSNGLLTVTANEDSANPMDISDGQSVEFGLDNDWRRIDLAGAGGGNVNIYVSNKRRDSL